jgi:glycosyltransferase involved in cell wall biosynthesis
VDIAIRAFQKVHAEMPTTEFHIYGEGIMRDSLGALAAELGLQDCVRFFDPLPVSKIADVMANADVGVVPKRADSFGNEAYSTKIMEFMSVGVPVIVSDTKIDRYYFPDSTVRFFESGNPAALAAATLEVLRDADRREEMIQRGLEYAALNNWQGRRSEYLRLVDELCAQGSDGAGA